MPTGLACGKCRGRYSNCCCNGYFGGLRFAFVENVYLKKHSIQLYRRKSPFARTQYLVSRLIRLTIETGFLTGTSRCLSCRLLGLTIPQAAVASVDLILDALKEVRWSCLYLNEVY